tara:strand:+ start:34 stop:366 length:333 start_codon:yes stop_codon:yes gene_type:complete
MCLGSGGSQPASKSPDAPEAASTPKDEIVRTPENPWATAEQTRLENPTDRPMLYRWDDYNESWKEMGRVLKDPALDLWVDPGGMDLPTYNAGPKDGSAGTDLLGQVDMTS